MISHLPLILAAMAAHFFAVITPGPDFIMLTKNSITHSRKIGVWTSVGFGLGVIVHITYCVLGLALVISESHALFNIVKYMGAGYLFYMGLQSFTYKTSKITIADPRNKRKSMSNLSAVKMGFLTNVLNPKATLFFLSLFSFLIKPETPGYIIMILAGIFVLNTILWFSFVSYFFAQTRVQNFFNRFQKPFNYAFGLVLIGISITIALSHL